MQCPKSRRPKKLVEKSCAFVDLDGVKCEEVFFGTGKSMYCSEHRKAMYRKIIDKEKIDNKNQYIKENTANLTFQHTYNKPETIIFACSLEGCCETFEIKINPNIYIYPKYCQEHRNEYRRQRFNEIGKRKHMQSI